MKLGIISPLPPPPPPPLLVCFAIAICVFALTTIARASPREDALFDGDIDVEDVAVQSPWRRREPSGPRRVVPAPTDAAWITLGGFAQRNTIDDRREVGGFVIVGLPLDRFARGSSSSPSSSPLPLERTSGETQSQPLPFELALTPRLARSCVSAAWRAAGLSADDARLDAIVSRAHWSAMLPEARLRAVRFEDARLSLDTGTDTSKLRDSSGANIGLEARLTWRFDRLLYADDEPAFERIRLEQHDARSRIGARVLEALFHWQRAALDLRSLPPSQHGTRDEADVMLRVMEAEAALDVLTNGWFTTYRGKRSTQPSAGSSGTSYTAPVPITRPADL